MTRTLGIVFIAVAAVACVLGAAFFGAGILTGDGSIGGSMLGFIIVVLVLVLPLGAVGVITLTKSRTEQSDKAEAADLRQILDMVKTRGQVQLSDIVIELESDTESVREMVYRIVGMGLFSGYINWDDGTLYSNDAAGLRDLSNCKNCGGQIALAGKGVAACPHCGTEYFLST